MQDQVLTSIQIRTIFYVGKKHKWKIITLFLSTIIAVAVGSFLATPIYRASSRLLVKPGREDIYVSPTAGSPAVIDRFPDQKINSEIEILKSTGLLVDLVNKIGLRRLFVYPDSTLKAWLLKKRILRDKKKGGIPPIDEVYKSMGDSLEVSNVPKSNVIDVSFDWPDPVIAADVVNTLVDLYLTQHVKVHTNPQTYDLLKQQAEKWENELRRSEKSLETFKRRHSITSLPQQKTMLLEKLSEIESYRRATETEIQETAEMIATLNVQLADVHQNVQLEERIDKNSESLAALKAKLVDLQLQGLKEEIARVKQMIAEEEKKEQVVVVSGKSPIRQSLEGDLLKARARLESLKAKEKNQKLQIARYKEELKGLDGLEKQMNELERQVEINEGNYKLYLTRFEEGKITEDMDRQKIANISIIQPAMPPLKPIKPRKTLNVLIGSFLGLFAGVGMAFLIEFVNPVFRTREDVDQFLGLPVLATLPKQKHS